MQAGAAAKKDSNRLSKCRNYFEGLNAKVPQSKALIDGPDGLTYGELLESVPKVGIFLESLSVKAGDRIVIVSERDSAVATLFFGSICHGITAVLMNPGASDEELATLMLAADPAAIFADEALMESQAFRTFEAHRPCVIPIEKVEKVGSLGMFFRHKNGSGKCDSFPRILAQFNVRGRALPDIDEETIAFILFTSGTTSRPKGVQISHRSLFAQMETFVRQYGLDSGSRILNILPLHHTDGLTHGVVVSLVAGAEIHRPMQFSVDRLPELLDQLYKRRISHFITVPSVLALIRQLGEEYRDTFHYPDFRFVISTAAYLDERLWSEFQKEFALRIVNVYGLTETVCEACYCGPDEGSYRLGTVGKPIDCEAAILDEDGNSVAAGVTGELALRGDNIMSGYFRMPEETAEVIRNGWFRTGDLATIDEDGFVRIVGRKKSVIVTGGYNVYPEDVANVLRSIDGVLDAAVFGTEDEVWGERVVALVIPAGEGEISIESLARQFLSRASQEKLPRDIFLVGELPRGPAGKVVIGEAKELAAQLREQSQAVSGGDVENTLYELAAKSFKVATESLTPSSGPGNTDGWNSLAHVEFLLAIESVYGIRLEAREIMNIDCLQKAVDIVLRKKVE
jgi:long-chain acyl-CoA synthetase